MDYKRIIKSQELRLKILGFTEFIPDKPMIKLQYKIATGRKLNLKNPKRFTEKLQWYKLNYRNPLMTQCADKYEVRRYIEKKGYEDILIPLYGVYDSADDIDFSNLPDRFVLKTTNGSQTNILCNDKNKLDIKSTRQTLDSWINNRPVKAGREWAYYNIKPKIICEKYLDKDHNNDIVDYKFFCFKGHVECLLICKDRFSQSGLKMGFYDRNFKFIDIDKKKYSMTNDYGEKVNVEKPQEFTKMLYIAEKLSKDFPHVRVDLYNIRGKIYFGELTFYDASGYVDYGDFDIVLGKNFDTKQCH